MAVAIAAACSRPGPQEGLCPHHLGRLQAERARDDETLAELLGPLEDFSSPANVNFFLGNLLKLMARKRIDRRDALAQAYICQFLLNLSAHAPGIGIRPLARKPYSSSSIPLPIRKKPCPKRPIPAAHRRTSPPKLLRGCSGGSLDPCCFLINGAGILPGGEWTVVERCGAEPYAPQPDRRG